MPSGIRSWRRRENYSRIVGRGPRENEEANLRAVRVTVARPNFRMTHHLIGIQRSRSAQRALFVS